MPCINCSHCLCKAFLKEPGSPVQSGNVVATQGKKMRCWKAAVGCLSQGTRQWPWRSFPPGWAVSRHLTPHVEATNANPALVLKDVKWRINNREERL